MAEKFSVKYEGKGIWAGMAMTEAEAKACAKLANKGIPEEEMIAEIIPFVDAKLSSLRIDTSLVKTRKPRADKGQPRKSSTQQPQRETTGRRSLVAENVKICTSRAELETYLTGIPGTANVRIFNYTHELKAKSQFKLETIK